jgi:LCP family protein required for cell wall assembly
VQLSDGSYDKINSAMSYGGPMESVRTVERYLGIRINHVMVVNFKGFPKLVNAVGGLDYYVPETISSEFGTDGHRYTVEFAKGMHHFDGREALEYVRIRYADDDFHRAARQQAIVQALTKKLVSPANLPRLPEIGTEFMRGVATDMSTFELVQLGYLKWRANAGAKTVLKGTPEYIGGVAYVMPPDSATVHAAVGRFLNR